MRSENKMQRCKDAKRHSNNTAPLCIHASELLCIYLLFAICYLLFPSLPAFAKKVKISTPEEEYKYEQNIHRQEEVEKYNRSLLPQSGCMTTEEYEELSKDVPNSQKVIPEPKLSNDINMKYVPQPIYKLAHYNNPPGSPELHIGRNLKFNRSFTCPGITSPNKDILVYPVVYYYASNQCTSCDLFVIPLDKSLTDVERIQRANIIKRIPTPILSTQKDITEKFTFRTMTPVDFSADGSKLLAKEKIGNVNDGIWQTNLWVYDFNTQKARQLYEIRDAIKFYWLNSQKLILDERRWDITPLGFDALNPDRIIVCAYGYTGGKPVFLGLWSIDSNGERSLLVSLFKETAEISMNGYKIVQDGVVNPTTIYNDEKRIEKTVKQKRKAEKKENKLEAKQKKQALNKKLKEMKLEEKKVLKEYNKELDSRAKTIGD